MLKKSLRLKEMIVSAEPKLFLILDDEESIRRSIAAFMEDEGYIVFQASTGEDALEVVKNHAINEAVVDIRLPGMDGDTFIIEARKILPDIRFVIHTGSSEYVPSEGVKSCGITEEKIFFKPTKNLKDICQALKR